MNKLPLVLVPTLVLGSCAADPWRERASTFGTGCTTAEVQVSERTSGALTNTWTAQCQKGTFHCSVAAAAEPDTTAQCTRVGDAPPSAIVAAPAAAAAPVAAPSTPPPAAPTEFEAKLAALKRAHDQSLITDQEYEAKRKELLKAL